MVTPRSTAAFSGGWCKALCVSVCGIALVCTISCSKVSRSIGGGSVDFRALSRLGRGVRLYIDEYKVFPNESARRKLLDIYVPELARLSKSEGNVHKEWIIPREVASERDGRKVIFVARDQRNPQEIWLVSELGVASLIVDINPTTIDWPETWIVDHSLELVVGSPAVLEQWADRHPVSGNLTIRKAGDKIVVSAATSGDYSATYYLREGKLYRCMVSWKGANYDEMVVLDAAGRIIALQPYR